MMAAGLNHLPAACGSTPLCRTRPDAATIEFGIVATRIGVEIRRHREPSLMRRRAAGGTATHDRKLVGATMSIDTYELALTLIGLAALLAAWAPAYTSHRPVSVPVVLVGIGALVFLLPLGFPAPLPQRFADGVERLTEFVVIVSLMGAGLKIDRPFSWRRWSSTWRMLAIAMPLTIAATALLGATVAGLGVASALLLGSVLAPTDPVLASDVQVGEPTLDEATDPDAEEEVRFTLTSEAGLNDALAFPFVYLALVVNAEGWAARGLVEWVAWDLVGRIAIGLAVGLVIGWVLSRVAFRPPGQLTALAESRQGFVAIAATLLAYGGAELLSGYGFLSVFVAALVLRNSERQHDFHEELHGFTEQIERLTVAALLVLFGGALASGVLSDLTLGGVAVAALLILVVRPIGGMLALAGTGMSTVERTTIAFFGIRGFGSMYYLAYATSDAKFEGTDQLWAIVAATILASVVVHGITATPAMRLVDRWSRRSR